jgi:hypothetical protein
MRVKCMKWLYDGVLLYFSINLIAGSTGWFQITCFIWAFIRICEVNLVLKTSLLWYNAILTDSNITITNQHGSISQKTSVFIITPVRTSNINLVLVYWACPLYTMRWERTWALRMVAMVMGYYPLLLPICQWLGCCKSKSCQYLKTSLSMLLFHCFAAV